MNTEVLPFPDKKFSVIMADPPWEYHNWSDKKNGAARSWYDCMSVEEICSLPVPVLADDNCALFLWCPWAKIIENVHTKVMTAWGFRIATCAFLWNKTYSNGKAYMGLGFYTRNASEACFLGIKGQMKRKSSSVYQVITAPRRKHSQKPDETYSRIEQLYSGPYIELFARNRHPGWSCWGNEAPVESQEAISG